MSDKPKPKLLRFDSQETFDMLNEIKEYNKSSVNSAVLFCIKEYYTKVFKKP